MRANIVEVAIDELLNLVVKRLDSRSFLVARVTFASSFGVREFLLHLLPFGPALFSLGPRRMSSLGHLLGCILEHLSRVGSLAIACPVASDLYDAVKKNCNLVSVPVSVSFP